MAVVSKTTLKSYFNDGDVPTESNYVDLIDTMGDMSVADYDSNDDDIVDAADYATSAGSASTASTADYATNSGQLGGVAAVNYLQRVSANRPGVTKLYRIDSDSGYYVRHYWTGTHWYLQGYSPSDVLHAGCRVEYANTAPWSGITGKPSTYTPSAHTHPGGDITSAVASATNADTVDNLHASQFVRSDANDSKTGYLSMAGGLAVGNSGLAPSAGHIWFNDSNLRIYDDGANCLRIWNNYGYIDIGANSNTQAEFTTGESIFVFNKSIYSSLSIVSGSAGLYATLASSTSNAVTIQKHDDDGHIWIVGEVNVGLRLNYYGNTTKTTHIHNGTSAYGDIHADNFVNESTIRTKHNVRPLSNHLFNQGLDVVSLMMPIAFEKDNTGDRTRMGFAAEDLYHLLPHVVAVDPETQHPVGIDYGQLVPLLVLAIQELKEKIDG